MMLKNQNFMRGKSLSSFGIFTNGQLPQSGIGIPASGSAWWHWSGIAQLQFFLIAPSVTFIVFNLWLERYSTGTV
jgi:hypothetical protein